MMDITLPMPTLPAPLAMVHTPDAPRPLPAKAAAARRAAGGGGGGHPAAAHPLCTVIGVLQGDAQWRVTPGARPVGLVIIHIDQPGLACIRATQIVGTEPLAHVAGHARAARLRAGTLVQVTGTTLVPHPSCRSIELLGVTELRELVLPDLDTRINGNGNGNGGTTA